MRHLRYATQLSYIQRVNQMIHTSLGWGGHHESTGGPTNQWRIDHSERTDSSGRAEPNGLVNRLRATMTTLIDVLTLALSNAIGVVSYTRPLGRSSRRALMVCAPVYDTAQLAEDLVERTSILNWQVTPWVA